MASVWKQLKENRMGDHPLHPIFVHLPIGLWATSFIFDVTFLITNRPVYATIAYYSMGIGIIGAVLAAITGLSELRFIPRRSRIRDVALIHMALNVLVTAVYCVNFVVRRQTAVDLVETVPVANFILSLVAIVLLSVSGYLGGTLVYKFGVGSDAGSRGVAPEGPEATEEEVVEQPEKWDLSHKKDDRVA